MAKSLAFIVLPRLKEYIGGYSIHVICTAHVVLRPSETALQMIDLEGAQSKNNSLLKFLIFVNCACKARTKELESDLGQVKKEVI